MAVLKPQLGYKPGQYMRGALFLALATQWRISWTRHLWNLEMIASQTSRFKGASSPRKFLLLLLRLSLHLHTRKKMKKLLNRPLNWRHRYCAELAKSSFSPTVLGTAESWAQGVSIGDYQSEHLSPELGSRVSIYLMLFDLSEHLSEYYQGLL